jgi:hypothetical protein
MWTFCTCITYTLEQTSQSNICVGQFNHQNYLGTRCKPNSLSVSQSVASTGVLLPSKVSNFMPMHCIRGRPLTGRGTSAPPPGAAPTGTAPPDTLPSSAPAGATEIACLRMASSYCMACLAASIAAGLIESPLGTCGLPWALRGGIAVATGVRKISK